MSITSKEIIKRIVHHDNPTRIGYKFLGDNPTDIMSMPSVRFINPKYDRYSEWGYYPEIVSQVPWFKGEVRVMENGNIYGRFDSKTKGECIKGVIQDGWELLESFVPSMIDEELSPAYVSFLAFSAGFSISATLLAFFLSSAATAFLRSLFTSNTRSSSSFLVLSA